MKKLSFLRRCRRPQHRSDLDLVPHALGQQCELLNFPKGKGCEKETDHRLWHPAAPGS
jgi:hypothetical protein